MKHFIAVLFLLLLPVMAQAMPMPEDQEYTFCGCCPCCADANMGNVQTVCLFHRKGDSLSAIKKKLEDSCAKKDVTYRRPAGQAKECSMPVRHFRYCDGGRWPPILYDPTPGAPEHSN